MRLVCLLALVVVLEACTPCVRPEDSYGAHTYKAKLQHEGSVLCAVFSPDGCTLATSTYDGIIRIWGVTTGKELVKIKTGDGIESLDFSPDGKVIVSAGTGPLIQFRDTITGNVLRTINTNERTLNTYHELVSSVRFSPDGKILAAAEVENNKIALWRVESGNSVLELDTGFANSAYCVRFSPDGKTLAAGTDHGVQLWDASSGRKLLQVEEHDRIHRVEFSPDGKALACASGYVLIIVEVGTGKRLLYLDLSSQGGISSLAFSPHGKTVVIAESEGSMIRIVDSATGKAIRSLQDHKRELTCVAVSPDRKTLASGAHDATVLLWDMNAVR